MGGRPPMGASWPERLTRTPCAVTLSMSLGDFVEVLEKNRRAWPVRPERDPRSTSSSIHFPLELTEPGPIALPVIPQDGRGRPVALTNARARKIIAAACTGASIAVCAEAGGVTPNTLKSWLRRKDHEAYLLFQRAFAEAETYATLSAVRAIMEEVASDPKHAFAFLARRCPDLWSKVVG